MAQIEQELTICTCCAIAAANADTSGHEYYCQGEPAPLSTVAGMVVVGELTDDFSRRQCDGCGSQLAGERLSAFILS